jgi:hypothetical protein
VILGTFCVAVFTEQPRKSANPDARYLAAGLESGKVVIWARGQ